MSRKQTEEYIIKEYASLSKVGMQSTAVKQLQAYFASLSNIDFKKLIDKMKDGYILPYFAQNMSDSEMEKGRILDALKRHKVKYNHRIVYQDPDTGMEVTTPIEHMVIPTVVRRLSQNIVAKRSMPTSTKVTDHLSGQVTGDSKGASMSGPEIALLEAQGFNKAILESIKVQGGDELAFREAKKIMRQTGGYSIDQIIGLGTKTKINYTISAILFAMYIDNNLIKDV